MLGIRAAVGPRLRALPVLLAVLPLADVPDVVVANNTGIWSCLGVLVAGPRKCALPVPFTILPLTDVPGSTQMILLQGNPGLNVLAAMSSRTWSLFIMSLHGLLSKVKKVRVSYFSICL